MAVTVAQPRPRGPAGARGRGRPGLRPARPRPLAGIVPFGVYVVLGLLVPTVAIAIGAFQNPDSGHFTLSNIKIATHGIYLHGFAVILELAVITSVLPGIFGFLIAYAIFTARRGPILSRVAVTASGVFANFGGVPLAFLFIATLGTTGIATGWLTDLGFNPYNNGFNLYHLRRRRPGLHVLPDPADGAGHPARVRGPAAGLARGGREPGRAAAGSTGATSAARC